MFGLIGGWGPLPVHRWALSHAQVSPWPHRHGRTDEHRLVAVSLVCTLHLRQLNALQPLPDHRKKNTHFALLKWNAGFTHQPLVSNLLLKLVHRITSLGVQSSLRGRRDTVFTHRGELGSMRRYVLLHGDISTHHAPWQSAADVSAANASVDRAAAAAALRRCRCWCWSSC